MSLDVSLYSEETFQVCPHCGTRCTKLEERQEELYTANITHNLGGMAEAAGLYKPLWRPEEIGIKRASDLIPLLEKGLEALRIAPSTFKSLNPPNGWGNYEGLVKFVQNYLDACRKYPNAQVKADR